MLTIYLDHAIIPADTNAEGLQKLQRVLTIASECGLELNINKFLILQCEIGFLSFHSKSGQLHPSLLKTKAVLIFQEQKNMKDA